MKRLQLFLSRRLEKKDFATTVIEFNYAVSSLNRFVVEYSFLLADVLHKMG